MNRLIIVGSPRVSGRSAHLANMLFETCIEECPDDELALAPVSTLSVAGCVGCDACRDNVERLAELGEEAVGDDFSPCAIEDDMQEIYELIDAADEITVVSPVYFAGPPSQLKALLDRLQPYYWTNARFEEKRPAVLHVVGEGGDPHGFGALVSTVRSALAIAGFRLEVIYDWVGKIDESGEIVAEAKVASIEEYFAGADAAGASANTPAEGAAGGNQVEGDGAAIIAFPQGGGTGDSPHDGEAELGATRGPRGGARTKLSLDAASGTKTSHGKGASGASRQGGGKQQPAGANDKPKGGRAGSPSRKPASGQGKRSGGQQGSARKGGSKKGNRRG